MNLDLFCNFYKKKLIRPQILHTMSEKYVQYTKTSVSKKGLPGKVFLESANSKRVKSYFKKKNQEKYKNSESPKKTQKCITKKIVDFSWLFWIFLNCLDYFGFFEFFRFCGFFLFFWIFENFQKSLDFLKKL